MNYFFITLILSLVLMMILKPLFMHTRPLFDDPSLADQSYKDCSGEFGMPSGHALNFTTYLLVIMWYYLDVYKHYFNARTILKSLIKTAVVILILGCCYSRVYLGRHSIDQVLIGGLEGFVLAHFFHFYWRVHWYDKHVRMETE